MTGAPTTTPVTDALLTFVAAATSAPVGDAIPPIAAVPPFAVVYLLPGGSTWGPDYADPQGSAAIVYQVTSVAVTRAGVEAHADTVRSALLDRGPAGAFTTPLTVAGLTVLDRELVAYGGIIADRGAYNVADVYQITVTP